MSGSSCVTTGCRTACSNPIQTSSITAATRGTGSPITLGALCPSDYGIGRTGSDQRVLVLAAGVHIARRDNLGRVLGAHLAAASPKKVRALYGSARVGAAASFFA